MSLTWTNATYANGPKVVAWLERWKVPTPSHPCREWREGGQATVAAVDRIVTRNGLHLSVLPDEVWEPRRPRVRRSNVAAVLAADERTGSRREAARVTGLSRSTVRSILDRERQAA
jgi:hypothetical protein